MFAKLQIKIAHQKKGARITIIQPNRFQTFI